MSLYNLLQQRAEARRPIRVGVIGAGRYGSMLIAQARIIPGIQLVGVAEKDVDKARQVCLKTGWPEDVLSFADRAPCHHNSEQ